MSANLIIYAKLLCLIYETCRKLYALMSIFLMILYKNLIYITEWKMQKLINSTQKKSDRYCKLPEKMHKILYLLYM